MTVQGTPRQTTQGRLRQAFHDLYAVRESYGDWVLAVDLDGSRRVEKRMLHGGSGQLRLKQGDFAFRGSNAAAMEFGESVRRGRVPGFQKGVDEAAKVASGGALAL